MPAKATTSKNETGSVIEQVSFTIGTLAALTGLIIPGPVVTRGGKLLSTSLSGGHQGGTLGDPKLTWGVMNADFTLAELEAFLELDGPLSPELKVESEISSRGKYIRTLGVIDPSPGSARSCIYMDNVSLKGLKFSESGEGSSAGWDWWVYNTSAATPMTTGGFVEFQARDFVEWNPSG